MILDLPSVPSSARANENGATGHRQDFPRSLRMTVARPEDSASRFESCRFCAGRLHDFVDLGMSPLCESFLGPDELDAMAPFYPLKVLVCGTCFLAQVKEYVAPERIFREYAYFSSYSEAWLEHARRYANMAAVSLGARQLRRRAREQRRLPNKGFPVLGIDPAENVARAAEARGVPTLAHFFDLYLARELASKVCSADLVIGNNVLAQVPDLTGFLGGVPVLLKPRGVATFEFPHLLRLIDENQFDTTYHEHFWYFSLMAAERMPAAQGLRVLDVEDDVGSWRLAPAFRAPRR